jgi:hypothetical protein
VNSHRFQKNVLLIKQSPNFGSISDITKLIDEVRPESHAIIWGPWEATDFRFDEYLKHNYNESPNHPTNFLEFENILIKHNIKCYLLVGCDYSDAYSNIKTNPIKNFEVLFWPTALLHYTYYGMINFYGKKPSDLFNPYKSIDKLYLNLNNHDRNHRIMMMDLLCKFELFHCGINTWNSKIHDGQFKYFKPQNLIFDDFNERPDQSTRIFSEKLLTASNLIDIITETSPILGGWDFRESNKGYIFHTEKTFKSILLGKPFLVLGNKGQNMNLQKYGISLFNNIFDYSFDKSESFYLRCLGIIDNLYEYKSKNFSEVRDMVINILTSNINTATAIVYNDVYMPILLRKIIHENKDDYKVLLKNYDEWRLSENIFKEIYQ